MSLQINNEPPRSWITDELIAIASQAEQRLKELAQFVTVEALDLAYKKGYEQCQKDMNVMKVKDNA
jgi:hypothetical protein